jgi:hypothetical protein
MLTNILIGLLCYSVFLCLFLVGWHRHCKNMSAYDAAMDFAAARERVRIVAAGVRPYPE